MKSGEKKMIVIIVIVGIFLIGGILLIRKPKQSEIEQVRVEQRTEEYAYELEDGTRLNRSDKLKETKKLDGMEITGIQLTNRNGVSRIIATVTNTTNRDIELTPVKVILCNDKKQVLEEIKGLISPVKAGESVQFNVGITADYANAYDFTIEKR